MRSEAEQVAEGRVGAQDLAVMVRVHDTNWRLFKCMVRKRLGMSENRLCVKARRRSVNHRVRSHVECRACGGGETHELEVLSGWKSDRKSQLTHPQTRTSPPVGPQ